MNFALQIDRLPGKINETLMFHCEVTQDMQECLLEKHLF